MQSLLNKKIVLGISGGIAAYKTPELARLLMQEGASVQVIMTDAAQQFVTPVTIQALTGNPVYTSQWDNSISNNMAHIELSRAADAIVIAPGSADLMAKLSLGLADDLLSTLCLARDCPLLIAPAMNKQMWEHAATQRSVERLSKDGVTLLGPASGFQACGEVGMGRMLEPSEIAEQVIAIDPVRGITNHSSGKMGFAIARAALEAGAQVHLIAGPCHLPTPLEATGLITRTNVVSAKEMHAATLAASDCDIFFAVAAVADWGIAKPAKEKIKRNGKEVPNIEFVANPDILLDVAKTVKTKGGKPHPYCVGFAAESTNLEKHADEKRKRKGIPMIVGNIGPDTFGSDLNQLLVVDASGSKKIAKAEKLQLARQLIGLVAKKI
jgi:phosphopantothenoylcysteine decarboxylase/phosphopantothenate--cysteine ligase